MTNHFGALRELLNQPGNNKTWQALVEWLDAQQDQAWLEEVVVPYCHDHLKHHWPAHIQVRPPHWHAETPFGRLGNDPLWCFEQQHPLRHPHITPNLHTSATKTHSINIPKSLYRRGQMSFDKELVGGYPYEKGRLLLVFCDGQWIIMDVQTHQAIERGHIPTEHKLFCATWYGHQLVALTEYPHRVITCDFKTHQTRTQHFLEAHTLRDKHLYHLDEAHLLMQTAKQGRLHIVMWHLPTAQAIYEDCVDTPECDQLRYIEPFNGRQYACVGFNETFIIYNPRELGGQPQVTLQTLDEQAITALYHQDQTTYRIQFNGTITAEHNTHTEQWSFPRHFAQSDAFVDGTIRVDEHHIALGFSEFPTETNEAVEYYFLVFWDLPNGQPTGCISTNINIDQACELAWDLDANCVTLIDVFEHKIETHWFDPPPPIELDDITKSTTHSVLVRANRRLLASYHRYGPTDANNDPWVEAIDNEDERMFMEWLPAQRGATQEALLQTEARLNITLPGLYRHQMSIANGWPLFHTFPCYTVWVLFPLKDLHWAYENQQFMSRLAAQTEALPTTHALSQSLVIGVSQDGQEYLLMDPHMQTRQGDWRVWEASSVNDVITHTMFWEDYQQFILGALYDEDVQALGLTR